MNKSCKFLSNGYKFALRSNNDTLINPCCTWQGEPFNINHGKEKLDQYRQKLNDVNALTNPACSGCIYLEEKNLRKSFRQIADIIITEDYELGECVYAEFQLDTTCNGACITCWPELSSTWRKELGISHPKPDSKAEVDKILKLVNFDKTIRFSFLGGEPFLSNVDEYILSSVNDYSEAILKYTTNGSVFARDSQIELWRKCQAVVVNFSLDQVGDYFDYIRYPLKWEQVEPTIERFNKLGGNITTRVNHTINILNLYYYDVFEDWISSNYPNIEYNFNPAVGVLSPTTVTPALNDLIVEKYGKNHPAFRVIKNVVPSLPNVTNHLDNIDKRRGLNWREVFPEIAHVL